MNHIPLNHLSVKIKFTAVTTAMFSLLLMGCAANRLHDEGMALIDQGQVVEGLDKLEAAVKESPKNIKYRTDLIQRRERAVHQLLINADSERSAGRANAAALLYQRTLQIDPENRRAKDGLERLEMDRRHAVSLTEAQALFNGHDLEGAQRVLKTILLENPAQSAAKMLQRKIDEQIAKDAMAGPTLKPEFKKPVTLQFRDANLKMVIEALSRSNSINILLDKEVKNDLKTTIFVKDASIEETIDLILLQNQLEKKILSDNTVLIYPNTPVKLKEYQDLIIRSFHLTNASAKEMQTMVKTLLKTRDLYVDEKNNSLVMRDTPDAIRLAEKLIAAQDLAEPEVMLEVEVLEITRARLTELGIKLPEQIAISASGTPETTRIDTLPGGGVVTTTTPAQPLTLKTLANINNTFFNVSPINASLDMRRETGDANILASPRIRVRNREQAKILIGDRVPVITNAVTPVASGSPVVTGNVQYLDVGLKLDVEPDIHPDDDVAIKVNLEVSSIVRELSSGPTLAYQIGARTANTVLRLKDGETQVLAGLINDEDRKTAQKFPGLGDLPILGRLFSSHKDDSKKTEIVLSITPHLTRTNQRPDAQNIEFWSGTDTTLRSRPLAFQQSYGTGNGTTAPSPAATSDPTTKPAAALQPSKSNSPISAVAAASASVKEPQPLILSWQGPSQAKVGDEFQVVVEAEAFEALSSLSFTLGYDPQALEIKSVAEGTLLTQGGKDIFTSKVDPKTGQAFFHMARIEPKGVTGKGSVVTVTFTAHEAQTNSPLVIIAPTTVGTKGVKVPPPQPAPLMVTLLP